MCNKTDRRDRFESGKKPGASPYPDPRRAELRAHPRGTALILTIVSLMLMAVLGMAYIQSVRVNRQAKKDVAISGNLDMVVQATLTQIGNVLKDDLLDGSGKFFNANTPSTDDPEDQYAGGGDEPYDYPWTNEQATQTVVTYNGTVVLKTASGAALGGEQDDTWLASTAPDMSDPTETNWTWPHITNLNGIFLNNVQNNNTFPAEKVVNYALLGGNPDPNHHDKDVRFLTSSSSSNALLNNGDLVDADGDGIADSRWTWAPVRKVGGVVYVMAVRIIDNSSLINANVALGILGDYSGVYKYDDSSSGTNSPRWWSPAELDLGGFVNSYNSTTLFPSPYPPLTNPNPDPSKFMGELQSLLDYRLNTSSSLPTPWGTSTYDRHHFWENGPAMYGNFQSPYRSLTIDDELELRHRNGLNDTGTVTTIETLMPHFLRTQEDLEDDEGRRYNDMAPPVSSVKDYYDNKNPRLWMTTISGAAIYAPPLDPSGNASLTRKVDLNQASLATLSAKIQGIWDAGTPPTPYNPVAAYSGWTIERLADQFAVCIEDYADADNKLTEQPTENGDLLYGMEALPAIAEVYAQRLYQYTSKITLPSSAYELTWTQQGMAGFAIEIRNPFPKPIKLTDVYLYMNGTLWDTQDLATLTEGSLNGRKETLNSNEAIILYRNSQGDSDGDNNNVKLLWHPIPSDPPDPNITEVLINSHLWPTSDSVTVSLHATKDDTASNPSPLPWAYMTVDTDGMPDQVKTTETTSPIGTPKDYRQRTAIGFGKGIKMLMVRSNEFNTDNKRNPGLSAKERKTDLANLGQDNKTNGSTVLTSLSLTGNQVLISDQGSVNQVGELAHIAIIGPDATTTIADRWNGTTDVTDFMLDFGSTDFVSSEDALAVPYAVLMLDRFTTMSPAMDNKDNDGDGIDDSSTPDPDNDELFVPGTINLNTVPGIGAVDNTNDTHLLQRVLPIQDRIVRRDVIKAILNYRDKAASFSATGRGINGSYRNNPGIAYIGELMKCVVAPLTSPNERIDVLANGSSYTGDTPSLSAGTDNYVVDFLSPSNAADGIADDREEEAMIMRWLSQTCSTRSDIFTAYVVIQGFPADDFSKGVVESRRFYAVFDRSRITGKDDAVRVLGVRELR